METNSALRRMAYGLYGLVGYAAFLTAILYAIGFCGNYWRVFGWDLPSMDVGPNASPGQAIAIDAMLLTLFAVQHSVMARQGFKRRWTRIVPPRLERSTFVLAASLLLGLLCWQWRPIGSTVWEAPPGAPSIALVIVSLAGWLVALLSTFMIDHLELFGLRQAGSVVFNRPEKSTGFATPIFYRAVRHPLYLGFMIAFWATPVMTMGHLFFAAATSAYILFAIQLEERDLVASYGESYRTYKRQVRMLLPIPRFHHADARAAVPPSSRPAV